MTRQDKDKTKPHQPRRTPAALPTLHSRRIYCARITIGFENKLPDDECQQLLFQIFPKSFFLS